ncbi:uncharacterized protein ACA1_092020 [Acanthamoeba castellanii str. Neff]|uniref:Uncharacterized protein n=1 Tax=Acanthamoeba castellanii (strain ATCC 30010 / Neff) TaxID=1257118 RepID=L8GI97_ACACF|nr:uncharacterized protein ACA1_092020 [Acanthamoeba castellanii str. Neff]ELR12692.1 hypothetical protein ACA1_092020 [Acanthamoeba castellanii str. Neff]
MYRNTEKMMTTTCNEHQLLATVRSRAMPGHQTMVRVALMRPCVSSNFFFSSSFLFSFVREPNQIDCILKLAPFLLLLLKTLKLAAGGHPAARARQQRPHPGAQPGGPPPIRGRVSWRLVHLRGCRSLIPSASSGCCRPSTSATTRRTPTWPTSWVRSSATASSWPTPTPGSTSASRTCCLSSSPAPRP